MLKLITALLLTAALLTPAHADLKEFERSGNWSAKAGGSADGTPMCLMSASSADRMVTIKWFVSSPDVFLHIFRNGWRVPPRAPMQFRVTVDKNAPFEGVARGLERGDGEGIEASFSGNSDALRRFLREIIEGDYMFFHFPTGNDPGWWISLAGTERVGRAFMRCITDYTARYDSGNVQGRKSTPQPHQGGQTTQPHQGGQVPQPHQGGGKRAPIPGERQI